MDIVQVISGTTATAITLISIFSWNLENNLKKKQTMYQPNPNIEQDKESAKQVAQACRDDGWLFASHTWGHNKVGDSGSYERLSLIPVCGIAR